MKISLECEIVCNIKLNKQGRVCQSGCIFEFFVDNNGIINRIKIISDVTHPEKFYSIFKTKDSQNTDHELFIGRDDELIDSIISKFQHLESNLSFTFGLKQIFWQTPKIEIIPETEDEKQNTPVRSISSKSDYPIGISDVQEKDLVEMIGELEKYRSMDIFKSFYREGSNDFRTFRYISAFYNYYFILEGLYSNNKTKNNQIETEFESSDELSSFVEWIVERIKGNTRHRLKIEKMLKLINKNLDSTGIIHLLVRTRGDLHHFYNNQNKLQATPYNHNEFESIAWLTGGLAYRAILQQIVKINNNQ